MIGRNCALLVAALALAMSACGGSGGGNEPAPQPPTFTVIASAGSGGVISPAGATVAQGATTAFNILPNAGFEIAAVSGCGGSLSGQVYTTGPITANCAVSATFQLEPEEPAERWTTLAPYPCAGLVNRTDAFLVEDDASWAGCGSNAQGFGLFRSGDGGATWAAFAPANAAAYFDDFRVNSITRSADGRLYVAGSKTSPQVMVAAIGENDAVETILLRGMVIGTSFHVGNFARDPAGRAIATSLAGTDVMMRASDAESFVALNPFTTGGSHQVLDLALHESTLHGAGSTITEPPLYHRPAEQLGTPVAFTPVPLAANFTGEMWGLAVAGDVVVLAGVDQVNSEGIIFRVQGDTTTSTRLGTVLPAMATTWLRDACAGDGHFAVVGHDGTATTAIVLLSTDGLDWEAITMDEPPRALHKCQIHDGHLYVAGADGHVARYQLD